MLILNLKPDLIKEVDMGLKIYFMNHKVGGYSKF